MKGRLVLRAGSGTQAIATGNGKQDTVSGGYSYLTGGTLVFEGQASVPGTGESTGSLSSRPLIRPPMSSSCLPIPCRAAGGRPGISGSRQSPIFL